MRNQFMLYVGIALFLFGRVGAQTSTNWNGGNDSEWSNPSNWAPEVLPSPSIKAFFNGPTECIVDYDVAEAWQIDLAGGPLKIIDGGVLTVHDWFILGYQAPDTGENAGRLEVYDGGVLNSMVRLYVGYRAEGYLTVYEGGTVNVHSQTLGVGQQPGGTGVVTLEGGTLNLLEGTNAESLNLYTADASIDFRGGVMTLRDTPENNVYLTRAIGDSIIKAYGGVGELVLDSNQTPGRIMVRGIHPLKPFPTDDGIAPPGQIELSWVLPDPCVPGDPVPVDVYFTDDYQRLKDFTDPEAIRIVSQGNVTSVVVQTQPKKRYYWAVDTYVGDPNDPIWGPIFSFYADNMAPNVDAGADMVTWLEDDVRTRTLEATVTDDEACTVQWTVVSEPNEGNAVLETITAEDTSIALSAVGEYVLKFEAFDGEKTSSDTMTIYVYNNSCAAAQSLPDYEPLAGDLNGDCRVDDLDLALLQENWLKDNSLIDD